MHTLAQTHAHAQTHAQTHAHARVGLLLLSIVDQCRGQVAATANANVSNCPVAQRQRRDNGVTTALLCCAQLFLRMIGYTGNPIPCTRTTGAVIECSDMAVLSMYDDFFVYADIFFKIVCDVTEILLSQQHDLA